MAIKTILVYASIIVLTTVIVFIMFQIFTKDENTHHNDQSGPAGTGGMGV